MKTKHIQLFEQYSSNTGDNLIDGIYENWKSNLSEDMLSIFSIFESEEEDWLSDEELSSGERAAIARDNQVMSKEQLAALYLRALDKSENNEEPNYILSIPGMRDFAEVSEKTQKVKLTNSALADAIGLESQRTISRTVNKFLNLINGIGATDSEIIYNKLQKAYNFFKTQTPSVIATIAGEAIQDSSVSNKHRSSLDSNTELAAEKRMEKKKQDLKIGAAVYSLINELRRNPYFSDIVKAQATAIRKLSEETGMDSMFIKEAYKKYLTDKKIMTRLNYSAI